MIQSQDMNIEEYAKVAPQYYTDEVPPILSFLLKNNDFHKILDCGCGDGDPGYINDVEIKGGKKPV